MNINPLTPLEFRLFRKLRLVRPMGLNNSNYY